MAIQISGCPVIDNSRNLTNIANASTLACPNTYVLRDADGKIAAANVGTGITAGTALGTTIEGGKLICKSGSIAWIVAPNTAEVSRTWFNRDDASIRAGVVSCCLGWFVPTLGQLQNPGYTCRAFWDSFSSALYWSSTEFNAPLACLLLFNTGSAYLGNKTYAFCVRAFRCVTY